MPELQKEPQSTMKVRFPDCDPFNHLNNSRYIDYMILAREDQLLEQYGFDPYRLAAAEKVGWVSAQTQISYLAPAMLNETVLIRTRLLLATEKSLLLEGVMWDAAGLTIKAIMWTKLVHYNLRERRSEAHSPGLQEFFQQIVFPFAAAMTFEERVGALRNSISATV